MVELKPKWLLGWWLLAGLLLVSSCSRTSAEQRLRERLDAMRVAVQQRQVSTVVDMVAADFAGNDGLDRDGLRRLLQVQALAHAQIGASVGPVEVELQGDRATARFSVLLTGGSGRLLPDRAQAYAVVSGWREQDGEWQLYYAQWASVAGR